MRRRLFFFVFVSELSVAFPFAAASRAGAFSFSAGTSIVTACTVEVCLPGTHRGSFGAGSASPNSITRIHRMFWRELWHIALSIRNNAFA